MAAHALRSRRRRSKEAGFTLIEVMVAVLLTAIATSGLIGLLMVETRSAGYSRHATEATTLAQDTVEWLRTRTGAGSGSGSNYTPTGGSGGIFYREWSVAPNGSDFDDIYVRVGWEEDGIFRNVVLHSRRNP